MKKILIIYQLRTREYDNALLLKTVLEKRGYCVKIKNDSNDISLFEKYDFVIWPCMYNDEQYEYLSYRFNTYQVPEISLRYEQVFTEQDEKIGSMAPMGKAKSVPIMNWGEADYEYCKKNGVLDKYLKITGFITLDYLRPEFYTFWYSREEIVDKFNLPKNKKLLLFTSSFVLADNFETAKVQFTFKNNINDATLITNIHTRSRNEILNWLIRIIKEDENILVIYRPHPAEKKNIDILNNVQKEYYNNFRVISDLNIKQWILIVDSIATWISTSIAECYVAKKQCLILRSEKIPMYLDTIIYKDAPFITNYQEFKEKLLGCLYLKDDNNEFPISKKVIERYYNITNKPSYLRIVEEIEKCIDDLTIEDKASKYIWILKRWYYLIFNGTLIKILIKNIYKYYFYKTKNSIKSVKIRKKYAIEKLEDEVLNSALYKQEEEIKLRRLRIIIK